MFAFTGSIISHFREEKLIIQRCVTNSICQRVLVSTSSLNPECNNDFSKVVSSKITNKVTPFSSLFFCLPERNALGKNDDANYSNFDQIYIIK